MVCALLKLSCVWVWAAALAELRWPGLALIRELELELEEPGLEREGQSNERPHGPLVILVGIRTLAFLLI